ncbi:MAG: hypothetical protein R3Y07_02625 [Eubacteriales bacterium]
MLHFITMFAMYATIVYERNWLEKGIIITILSVFLTVYLWELTQRSYRHHNTSFIAAFVAFNFIGTILLMGFGIIITMPISLGYTLFIFSIPFYHNSFCGYHSPIKVALLLCPVFLAASLASGSLYWQTSSDDATGVFFGTYLVLVVLVGLLNYRYHKSKPELQPEHPSETTPPQKSLFLDFLI